MPLRRARQFDVHVSGGEYNVAANLSDCFGMRTGIATAMVTDAIGDLIQSHVRAMGVEPFYKYFASDEVRGPNMAIVYSDRGQGIRPPRVSYNRANEAAALLQPGDFPWSEIFGKGIRWFHSGGIFASLSATTTALTVEAIQAARTAGTVCSFDLNFREKLWNARGDRQRAQEALSGIVELVDVLIGNEEDLQNGLGLEGPDPVDAESQSADAFFSMMTQATRRFPNIKLIATTLRKVYSANRHQWSAVMWMDHQPYIAPVCELDVLDRIGGGDGFAAGLIFGLLTGRAPWEALGLGWAHGALLTTYPGDVTMATLAEVESFARGSSARVQR
jgi:2-dehydro-3-deoxygluconokinase